MEHVLLLHLVEAVMLIYIFKKLDRSYISLNIKITKDWKEYSMCDKLSLESWK
jgi:hypothetical protein